MKAKLQTVRVRVVQLGFVAAFLILMVRAAQVQIIQGGKYDALARNSRQSTTALPAVRGTIYDRNGLILAETQEIFRINLTRDEFENLDEGASLIAKHVGLPRNQVRRLLRNPYQYLPGTYNSAQARPLSGIRGVHLEGEMARFHPRGQLARSVIGIGHDDLKSGIERFLDSLLTGTPGEAVVLRDEVGGPLESPGRLEALPVPGHDVYLTLDADLQDLVERALDDAIQEFGAIGGEVIVVDPQTGEIMAVAARSEGNQSPAFAFTEAFEPGSTAKIFAAAALLAEDLVRETDSVWGGAELSINGRVVHDEHAEGWMTLRDIVRRSSNVGMAQIVEPLPPEVQFSYLRRFGLGTPSGVEFPGEAAGILVPPHRWSGTSKVSMAIGYEVAVTMVQLAQAYAAIANGGQLMHATLIHRIVDPNGKVVYTHEPEPVRQVVSRDVANEVLAMLQSVVEAGGTGESAALTVYQVAGKTGTTRRYRRSEGYIPGSHNASFASIFPADNPQLVMVVKLDDPESSYARLNAAPLTRSVLQQVVASEAGSFDRIEANRSQAQVAVERVMIPETTVTTLEWPMVSSPTDSARGEVAVPDVRGASLRAALVALHRAGLHARVVGSGEVQEMRPAHGSVIAVGDTVRLVGSSRRQRRP